jgi:hypothetical protein
MGIIVLETWESVEMQRRICNEGEKLINLEWIRRMHF